MCPSNSINTAKSTFKVDKHFWVLGYIFQKNHLFIEKENLQFLYFQKQFTSSSQDNIFFNWND